MHISEGSVRPQLISTLLSAAKSSESNDLLFKEYSKLVDSYVQVDNCIAVLSDFIADKSYMAIGDFGKQFGFIPENMLIDSAFEDCVFDKVHPGDLINRDLLELNYIEFRKGVPPESRKNYGTNICIRVLNTKREYAHVNHRTIYIKDDQRGNVHMSICIYSPVIGTQSGVSSKGAIIDHSTGAYVEPNLITGVKKTVLTTREQQVLALLAKGLSSKDIAIHLYIAPLTVSRHRQNIIRKLDAANTMDAVRLAFKEGILYF